MTGVLHNYLIVGSVLFVMGMLGFLTRRNLILMMLSAEMMLHGVSLNLVAFSRAHGNFQGQAFTVFILTVAACEAGLSLALILALYRRRGTLDVTAWTDLGEAPAELPTIPEHDAPHIEQEFPRLKPTGHLPEVPEEETAARV